MIWFVLGCLAAALALAGGLGASLIWAARRAVKASDEAVEAGVRETVVRLALKDCEKNLADSEEKREDCLEAIYNLQDSIRAEIAARKKAEAHAEKAIDELVKSGNAPAAATRLRADLERLRALSRQEVPEVPDAPTTDGG